MHSIINKLAQAAVRGAATIAQAHSSLTKPVPISMILNRRLDTILASKKGKSP